MLPKHLLFAVVTFLSYHSSICNEYESWNCLQVGNFFGTFPREQEIKEYDFDVHHDWNRFNPNPAFFDNNSLPIVRPWKETNEFYATVEGASVNSRLIVQIAMKEDHAYQPPYSVLRNATINETMLYQREEFKDLKESFNCFVKTRSHNTDGYCLQGGRNPRCCFGTDVSDWSPQYPPADDKCFAHQSNENSNTSCLLRNGYLKYRVGCAGVCYNAMILQLEFVPETKKERSRLYVGTISRRYKIHQKRTCKPKRDPYCEYFAFDKIPEPSRYVRSTAFVFPKNGTTFKSEEEFGFWMQWIESSDGPSLRIGSAADKSLDIVGLPFFGSEAMGEDWIPFGWKANTMKKPLMNRVFVPMAWTLQGVLDSYPINFKLECKKKGWEEFKQPLYWVPHLVTFLVLIICVFMVFVCCCRCPKGCCCSKWCFCCCKKG